MFGTSKQKAVRLILMSKNITSWKRWGKGRENSIFHSWPTNILYLPSLVAKLYTELNILLFRLAPYSVCSFTSSFLPFPGEIQTTLHKKGLTLQWCRLFTAPGKLASGENKGKNPAPTLPELSCGGERQHQPEAKVKSMTGSHLHKGDKWDPGALF